MEADFLPIKHAKSTVVFSGLKSKPKLTYMEKDDKSIIGVSEKKKKVAFTNYIWALLEKTLGHVANSTIHGQLPFTLKITQNKQLFRMK